MESVADQTRHEQAPGQEELDLARSDRDDLFKELEKTRALLSHAKVSENKLSSAVQDQQEELKQVKMELHHVQRSREEEQAKTVSTDALEEVKASFQDAVDAQKKAVAGLSAELEVKVGELAELREEMERAQEGHVKEAEKLSQVNKEMEKNGKFGFSDCIL